MNMTNPGISELSKYVDSRYTLVTMAAKRARMIGEKGEGLVPCDSNKAVSIAVQEIASGKVSYVRNTKSNNFDAKDAGLDDVISDDEVSQDIVSDIDISEDSEDDMIDEPIEIE